jgi:hypothetical protein
MGWILIFDKQQQRFKVGEKNYNAVTYSKNATMYKNVQMCLINFKK